MEWNGRPGLNRYAPKTDQWVRYLHNPENRNSLSDNYIKSILEDLVATLGENMLEHLGYGVQMSSSEAWQLFRAQPENFDLVITDMTMPQMTGDTLARKMMRIRPDIPIIICTG